MILVVAIVVFLVLFLLLGGDPATLLEGPGPIAFVMVGLLVLFLFMGLYVAAAVGAVGLLVASLFAERSLHPVIGQLAWITTNNFVFVAVPLFILMGELLLRSGLTDRLYNALAPWVSFLPGGMLHTNIAASALFSSACGSSMATAATVGTVALPYFKRGKYNERMVVGSLAAGGTLGILIPPSAPMIIYALLTDNSVGRLFLAGVIPGFLLAGLFMAVIGVCAVLRPAISPKELSVPWEVKLRGLVWLAPLGALIFAVMGSIYGGLATPTEAAALGVTGALILAACFRRLNFPMLREALESTARTTAMVVLILVFAGVFQFMISAVGLPTVLANSVAGLALPPIAILGVIILFYLVAGTFLDDLALTVTTLPVIYPVIKQLAAANPELKIFDGVAFGVLFVVLMQMAIITPPDGINLYVIQGLRRGRMSDIYVGVLPFVAAMALLVCLLVFFPQLALWLPSKAFGR